MVHSLAQTFYRDPDDQLAAIVQAQIGEGGLPASSRSQAMMRRTARAEATYGRMVNQLQADAGFETAEQTEIALEVVLSSLVRRLTPEEANDLLSQLPSLLKPKLLSLPPGPDKTITRESIEEELVQRLGVDKKRVAEILAAIGTSISQSVSSGQIEDVQSQLPEDMRSIFAQAA